MLTPHLPVKRVHHIGVLTGDLANSIAWYRDFLGCKLTWTLDTFSALTLSRLPGIERLAEMICGSTRYHLFECNDTHKIAPDPRVQQYQHICLQVGSPEDLRDYREHWLDLHRSSRYSFAIDDQATEIVVSDDGIQTFYCRDVNGLEFEFSYFPGSPS